MNENPSGFDRERYDTTLSKLKEVQEKLGEISKDTGENTVLSVVEAGKGKVGEIMGGIHEEISSALNDPQGAMASGMEKVKGGIGSALTSFKERGDSVLKAPQELGQSLLKGSVQGTLNQVDGLVSELEQCDLVQDIQKCLDLLEMAGTVLEVVFLIIGALAEE